MCEKFPYLRWAELASLCTHPKKMCFLLLEFPVWISTKIIMRSGVNGRRGLPGTCFFMLSAQGGRQRSSGSRPILGGRGLWRVYPNLGTVWCSTDTSHYYLSDEVHVKRWKMVFSGFVVEAKLLQNEKNMVLAPVRRTRTRTSVLAASDAIWERKQGETQLVSCRRRRPGG